jgi:hypothetical protein
MIEAFYFVVLLGLKRLKTLNLCIRGFEYKLQALKISIFYVYFYDKEHLE